jgi:hypothetical protein
MTLSITTLNITTLSITALSITTLSITRTLNDECSVFIVILNVVMLGVLAP